MQYVSVFLRYFIEGVFSIRKLSARFFDATVYLNKFLQLIVHVDK